MNIEILKKLIDENKSTYEIAAECNMSQTNVRHWLKKYGLKTKYRTITAQEVKDGYKTCPQCKVKKEMNINNFYIRKTGKFHHWCKECGSKKSVDRFREYKLKCVTYKGGKCIVCGYDKYFGALDFHHLDPSKKDFTVAASNKTFEALQEELDKCVLLCATCHRELHGGIIKLVGPAGLEPTTSEL